MPTRMAPTEEGAHRARGRHLGCLQQGAGLPASLPDTSLCLSHSVPAWAMTSTRLANCGPWVRSVHRLLASSPLCASLDGGGNPGRNLCYGPWRPFQPQSWCPAVAVLGTQTPAHTCTPVPPPPRDKAGNGVYRTGPWGPRPRDTSLPGPLENVFRALSYTLSRGGGREGKECSVWGVADSPGSSLQMWTQIPSRGDGR